MTAAGKVHAVSMAHAVQFDRQFRLPGKPRFITDLAAVWGPDYLLVDGTGELQMLRGAAVQSLLPRLIPLLDGDRTVDQAAAGLPDVTPQNTRAAVALMYTRGLLEDAEAGSDAGESVCEADTVSFFRRHVDVTRVNRSAAEAVLRLTQSQVYVLLHDQARGSVYDIVAAHLRSAGVAAVTPLRADGDLRRQIAESRLHRQALVVALIEEEEPTSILSELDGACAEAGVPWLRTSISTTQGRAEIGPYFESGVTPCYACFQFQKRPEALAIESEKADGTQSLNSRFWADMLAMEAIYLLSRIAPAASGIGLTSYDTVTWDARVSRLVRIPGCDRCRPGPAVESIDQIETALRYEDAVAFPPRHLVDPKAHQAHYHVSNIEMAQDCKNYPGIRVLPLPPLVNLPKPSGDLNALWSESGRALRGDIDLKHMAALLLLAGGVRERKPDGKVQRWAATGGNLGSVELYLAAAGVDDLDAGLYYYDSSSHGLALLPGTRDRDEMAALIRAWTADAAQNVPALVIGVAALHRVYRKYGAFAYRLIHLDAGVATAQLHLAAQAMGIATFNVEPWIDESILTALRLREDIEYVTAVVTVGSKEAANEHA